MPINERKRVHRGAALLLSFGACASPDGRYIIISNNGWAKPTLTVFDTRTEQVISRAPVGRPLGSDEDEDAAAEESREVEAVEPRRDKR